MEPPNLDGTAAQYRVVRPEAFGCFEQEPPWLDTLVELR
jgi:hypothetical protein